MSKFLFLFWLWVLRREGVPVADVVRVPGGRQEEAGGGRSE